jgi:outer membrane lipopolysaccharide assembly protein LptE/RlpB
MPQKGQSQTMVSLSRPTTGGNETENTLGHEMYRDAMRDLVERIDGCDTSQRY